MNIFITGVVMLANILALFADTKKGLAGYLILSLVYPVTSIGSMTLSYDLLFFFPLILILIVKHPVISVEYRSELIGYFIILLLATGLSATFYNGSIEAVAIFGYFRYTVLFFLVFGKTDLNTLKIVVYVVTIINVAVMLLQYLDPNSISWTYALYGKNSQQALAGNTVMSRFTGTFSNILPVAFFMMAATIVSLTYACEKKKNKVFDVTVLILSLLGGFLTASKTWFVGIPIVILSWEIVGTVWRKRQYKILSLKRILVVLLIVALAAVIISNIGSMKNASTINYYIKQITEGSILGTRYGEDAVLADMMTIFGDHPLLGVGCTRLANEFVGDSQLFTILHNSGIVGLVFILSYILRIWISGIKSKSVPCFTAILMLLAVSVAGTTFFSITGIILIAFARQLLRREPEIAVSENKSLREEGVAK